MIAVMMQIKPRDMCLTMQINSNENRPITGRVIPNKKLADWEGVIEEWVMLIDRYCRVAPDDAPYWYTERANIGILAGACWRSGMVALEEFQWEKGYRNKPKWPGRADLWVGSDSASTLIEAKQKFIALNSRDHIKLITQALNDAGRNAKESRGNQSDIRALGMVFLPVYIPATNSVVKVNQKIDDLVDLMKREYKGKLLFWHFPAVARVLRSSTGNYFPGVIVLAEEAPK